jgi:hypothetical protein
MLTKDGYRFHARKLRGDCCENCGTTDNLNAHHKDEDLANNSPENIQTLCGSCHTKHHWKDGKKPWKKYDGVCVVCGKESIRGMCETHRTRLKRHGDPHHKKQKIGSAWVLVDERTGKPVNGQECPA